MKCENVKGVPFAIHSRLLIGQLNEQTAVIPAQAGVFLQTSLVFEDIPASAKMTFMGHFCCQGNNNSLLPSSMTSVPGLISFAR